MACLADGRGHLGTLAILLNEPDAHPIRTAFDHDEVRLLSAATLLEVSIVIEARKGETGGRDLDLLIGKSRSRWSPLTRTRLRKRVAHGAASARDGMRPT